VRAKQRKVSEAKTYMVNAMTLQNFESEEQTIILEHIRTYFGMRAI
jgi:hypothetical protein